MLLIADEYPSTVYMWRAFAAQSGAEVVTVARDEQKRLYTTDHEVQRLFDALTLALNM